MGTIITIVAVMIIGDMVFVRNAIVDFEVFYFLINIYYFIDIFMVYDYRYRDGFLRLFILVIDVNVSFVDGCFTDFN